MTIAELASPDLFREQRCMKVRRMPHGLPAENSENTFVIVPRPLI